MTKSDFMFCIGYQGVSAIVDRQARNRYGKLSAAELAEQGLFKAAFCGALFENDEEGMNNAVRIYNEKSGAGIKSAVHMKRLLGVFSVPDNITKVTYV